MTGLLYKCIGEHIRQRNTRIITKVPGLKFNTRLSSDAQKLRIVIQVPYFRWWKSTTYILIPKANPYADDDVMKEVFFYRQPNCFFFFVFFFDECFNRQSVFQCLLLEHPFWPTFFVLVWSRIQIVSSQQYKWTHLLKLYNFNFRCIDDFLSLAKQRFSRWLHFIYPSAREYPSTYETKISDSYLDLTSTSNPEDDFKLEWKTFWV